jgi:hypothetical protein
MNSIASLPSLHLVFEPIDQRTSPNLGSTRMLFTAPARRAQPLTNLATAPSQSPFKCSVAESMPRGGVNRRSLLKTCTQELSLRLPGGPSAGSVRWALRTSAGRSRVRNATVRKIKLVYKIYLNRKTVKQVRNTKCGSNLAQSKYTSRSGKNARRW